MTQPSIFDNRHDINSLREALAGRHFFWTIEFIPSVDKILRDELHKLGGIAERMRTDLLLAGFAVTDRVVSERDPDPVAAASHLLDQSGKQPLVHFSGKGREIEDFEYFLRRLDENGLKNVLCITGDRLKETPAGGQRPRYLESVPAIHIARHMYPALLIATAVNPFKYREEDAMAQYLKLSKKVAAGANYCITQIGFDMRKHEEALLWMRVRGYEFPLVANVLPLSAGRARYIRQHRLAGVTVTDSFLSLLETEERSAADKGAAKVIERLALQIHGVRLLGYAGVQITGLHSAEKLASLETKVDELYASCLDQPSWQRAWEEALTLPNGQNIETAPGPDPWYLDARRASAQAQSFRFKYRLMDNVHRFIFDGGAARIVGPLLRRIKRGGTLDHCLARMERSIKGPLFGCETCGMCRLAATMYVCPETCPKGLANGACGGTTENLCEFGDRECIHSAKYRIARDASVVSQLENLIIPAVPRAWRGTSSWPPYFRREAPKIHVATSPSVEMSQRWLLGASAVPRNYAVRFFHGFARRRPDVSAKN